MFLYFFEDGRVAQSKTPPLPQDIEAIEIGILTVIKVTSDSPGSELKVKEINYDNGCSYTPVPEALEESNEDGEYHFFRTQS